MKKVKYYKYFTFFIVYFFLRTFLLIVSLSSFFVQKNQS